MQHNELVGAAISISAVISRIQINVPQRFAHSPKITLYLPQLTTAINYERAQFSLYINQYKQYLQGQAPIFTLYSKW
jgi:hypothetical protein